MGPLLNNVDQIRLGPLRFLKYPRRILGQKLGNFAVWIVKITKNPDLGRTGFNTGWFAPGIDAMGAESALVDRLDLFVVITGIVGTRGHTVLTTDTLIGHNVHNTVRVNLGGLGRANVSTGRIATVLTLAGGKTLPKVRILTAQPLLTNPVAIVLWPQRDIVLCLTGHRTGLAVDAAPGVEDNGEAFIFHLFHSLTY
jgi:hypothetical protein